MRGPVLGVGLAALVGCYSPTAPIGLACAPAGSPARCPAGQECVVKAGAEVCLPEGASGDVDASVDAPAVMIDAAIDGALPDGPSNWWNPAWPKRRPLDVTVGSNGMPAGYTVAITIDHRALVLTGQSLASGEDVRIVRDDGTPVDRVLDTGSAWGGASTKLWFRANTTAVSAGTVLRFWVYYGNLAATAAPASPAAVWLFADGFEGSTAAWSFGTGVAVSTARAHGGTRALATPPTTQASRGGSVSAVNESNVAWDVWCNIDNLTGLDISVFLRGRAGSVWQTNLQPVGPGTSERWNIASTINANYTEVVPPPPTSPMAIADTWIRVTFYAYESRMAVDINGVRAVPVSGFADVGASNLPGDVGVDAWNALAAVWFDDVTLRRLVLPEPVIAVGAVATGP
ncbi:MAG: hypothetical protein JNL83_23175 [Myxococcales bacterium]|nr:hypothetical protein [Myxococcales bacterium]